MFDLEKQIAEWRRQMLAGGIKPAPLAELENHLREEIEKQWQLKFTEEQAFELAVEKLGSTATLKDEFKKILAAKQARIRERGRAVLICSYGFGAIVAAGLLCKAQMTLGERLSGFTSLGTAFLLLWAIREVVRRHAPIIASKKVQSAIGVTGSLSGVSWFVAFVYLILPRFNLMPGQLIVTILWAILPMLVLPVAGFLITDKSERALETMADS